MKKIFSSLFELYLLFYFFLINFCLVFILLSVIDYRFYNSFTFNPSFSSSDYYNIQSIVYKGLPFLFFLLFSLFWFIKPSVIFKQIRKISSLRLIFKGLLFLITFIVLIYGTMNVLLFTKPDFPFNPYIATEFAPKFSWEKFDSVKNGMLQSEVKKIMGNYFYAINRKTKCLSCSKEYAAVWGGEYSLNGDTPYACWYYSDPKKIISHYFAWRRIVICFENRRVDYKLNFEYTYSNY